MSLRYPVRIRDNGDISRRLEDAIVYRLPDDYFAKYVANIEAVTAADVQRVAQKYVHPDRFAVVITGDRKVIEPGIAGAEARADQGVDDRRSLRPAAGALTQQRRIAERAEKFALRVCGLCVDPRRGRYPTCTRGRRSGSASAWRSTSRVTGAVSPSPNARNFNR